MLASLTPTPPAATGQRSVCYTCFRPGGLCYCDHACRLTNATRVFIVQHPREHFHPLGTARIVQNCLANVDLFVARGRSECAELGRRLRVSGAALLYPGPGARDLASIAEHDRPSTLVVLDGTWHHARTLYRDHAALRALPQYSFVPKGPTEYRVRREPAAHYVSTVEAVAAALEALEPGASYQGLLRPFRRMVDLHLVATAAATRKSRERRQRPAANRLLPRALAEEFSRVVVAYGEPTPHAFARKRFADRGVVYWTARRLGDGALFSRLVTPAAPLPPEVLGHMGIEAHRFVAGCSRSELEQRWREFLRPEDLVVAWNESTLALLRRLGTPVAALSLKAAYRRFRGGLAERGSLEAVIRSERLDFAPLELFGRAAPRLAQAEAVARFLRSQATVG